MRLSGFSIFTLLFLTGSWVSAAAIPVSGSGSYYNYGLQAPFFFSEEDFSLTFSGSNGVDSVSLTVADYFNDSGLQLQPSTISGAVSFSDPFLGLTGTATIDGLSSIYFSYSLGNGGGFVTEFDSLGDQLASVALISYLMVSKVTVPFEVYGTVLITSTPEPGTFGVVVLFGLAVPTMFHKSLRKKLRAGKPLRRT